MWYVYILQCSDGTFYTGITEHLKERIGKHNAGKGAKYTRSRRPVTLVFFEECESQLEAIKREIKIKKLSHYNKQQIIKWRKRVSLAMHK